MVLMDDAPRDGGGGQGGRPRGWRSRAGGALLLILLPVACEQGPATPQALHDAARQGEVNPIRRLAARGVDLESRVPTTEDQPDAGSTALIIGVRHDNLAVVEVLAELGADVNGRDEFRRTALHEASTGGDIEVLDALLRLGADPELADAVGVTPLMLASGEGDLAHIDRLVASGADVNRADSSGSTPLFWAATRGQCEAIRQLAAFGADVNVRADRGITPLIHASRRGVRDCVVTNVCGSATSASATLTVNTAPAITANPGSVSDCEGANVSFTVAASGTAPLGYQWRRNGTDVPGATSPTPVPDCHHPGGRR